MVHKPKPQNRSQNEHSCEYLGWRITIIPTTPHHHHPPYPVCTIANSDCRNGFQLRQLDAVRPINKGRRAIGVCRSSSEFPSTFPPTIPPWEAVGRLSECCRSRSDWLTNFWTGPSRSDWLTDFWIGPFRQTFPTILNLLLYRRG